jgi:hypothetical protein
MGRRSHISLGFMVWAVRNRKKTVARLVIRMKMTERKRINPANYTKKELYKLRKLNLIGYSKKRKAYWQRSWEEIHQILGIGEMTFVTMTHKTIAKYDFEDLAYAAGLQYKLRLQIDGRKPKGKPSTRKVRMQPSVHQGGIAHSLMASFFGRSIHWSYLRRQSCQARGLIRFTRRKLPAKELDSIPDCEIPYRAFDITSLADVRVWFGFTVPKWLRPRLERRVFDAKQGVYVYVHAG